MKYAAFSGSMMDYSIHEAMAITAKLGFDGLEIACREPHLSADTSIQRVREMRLIANEYDLAIPALAGYAGHFSESSDRDCEKALGEFCRLLEQADLLEAPMVRIFQGGPNAFLAADYHYEKAAYWLRKCAEEARQHDKRILLEIHNVSLVETSDSALRLLAMIGADNIGLIHDAGNMYIADTNYGSDSVHSLKSKLFHVHVKDEKRIAEAGAAGTFTNRTRHGMEHFLQCRLGEGEVDHRELFKALLDTDYKGWITLENFAPYPVEERLAYDLEVVRQWMDEAHNRTT
ncbi:sugar phosphate isomerase/epimerase family protein [Paenibacillus sp. GCM10028914]|uniref:sugar phosphate isomerase/epimerase family protein n=1 Tax=Paenibacillus sp. GCM10028914 TaxID=3273416 RepID=UPI00360FCE9A